MIIDLRSDTSTKPTAPMLEAMMNAEVGDDVFGEDPTVKILEQKAADYLGFEAGIFCPSGVMANQIGIYLNTNPAEQVICDSTAHIYQYEGSGMAFHSNVSARCINGENGKMTPAQIKANINPKDPHYPITSLIALENTCNKAGGTYYTMDEIKSIAEVAKDNDLKMHLDGARIWNAIVAGNNNPSDYGKYFDSASVCLSKALGCPIGSILLGSKELIGKALRARKLFGGGMRQVGYIAAAGIYALDHHIQRLKEDHQLAAEIGAMLSDIDYVEKVNTVHTNIIMFKLKSTVDPETFIEYLANNNVNAVYFGENKVRFVTHLNVDVKIMEPLRVILNNFKV